MLQQITHKQQRKQGIVETATPLRGIYQTTKGQKMWILPKNLETSSAFVADTLASSKDLALPDLNLEHSLMWRSKPSPLRIWSRRWNRVNWMPHLFGRILKPSQRSSFEIELTSSLLDTHASPFQPPESEREKMTPDTSGPTSENMFRQLNLFDAFLKTSKDTLVSDSEKSLKTWKALVIKRRLEYSARVKSARLIREKESTSWPTPTTQDNNQVKGKDKRGTTLGGAVRNWPTPTTQEIEHPNAEICQKTGRRFTKDKTGTHSQGLADAVRNWPTPTTQDNNQVTGQYANPKSGTTLGGAVRNWPTPAARDYKDSGPNVDYQKVAEKSKLAGVVMINQQDYPAQQSGSLNPEWVEWLMGVPTGWTDLGSWGMQSYHKQQRERGKF
jgi:hypothetical protein